MEHSASIDQAFRAPVSVARSVNETFRKQISAESVLIIEPVVREGWFHRLARIFLSKRTLRLRGLFEADIVVRPGWFSFDDWRCNSSARWWPANDCTLAILSLHGDQATHLLRIRSKLPFLHPFVPIHLEIQLDGEVVYAEGKYASHDQPH